MVDVVSRDVACCQFGRPPCRKHATPKPAADHRLVHRAAGHAHYGGPSLRAARPRWSQLRFCPLPAGIRTVFRPVDPHQISLGRRHHPTRHDAGHRRWLVDTGLSRRDSCRDRGHARDERPRVGCAPRSHRGTRQRLHAPGQSGHRRLSRGNRRHQGGPDRQLAVRRRPPDANLGRPDVATRTISRRPRRQEDRRQLGLLAELRQAAERATGLGDADDSVWGPSLTRPSTGLSVDGQLHDRGERQRSGERRLLRGGRLDGSSLRRRGHRLPQELGSL